MDRFWVKYGQSLFFLTKQLVVIPISNYISMVYVKITRKIHRFYIIYGLFRGTPKQKVNLKLRVGVCFISYPQFF